MSYAPGTASKERLKDLCLDMTKVIYTAYEICEIDFSVIETKRSPEQQEQNIHNGVSWSMDSDHLLDDEDGTGVLAVDLYPWVDGQTSHDTEHYNLMAKAMFRSAGMYGVQIKWGGFWGLERSDKPHWAKRRNT